MEEAIVTAQWACHSPVQTELKDFIVSFFFPAFGYSCHYFYRILTDINYSGNGKGFSAFVQAIEVHYIMAIKCSIQHLPLLANPKYNKYRLEKY